MHTRRTFLARSLGAAGAALALSTGSFWGSQTTQILLNHLGFTPDAAKFCLLSGGAESLAFNVLETTSAKTAQAGTMQRVNADFGSYLVGDFSALRASGSYQIQAGDGRSATFVIDANVYTPTIRKCIEYFSVQRCGDSKTGYHAPCHLDDGKRADTGEHRDVSGGWHDACDLRKWVDATVYGMIGLSRVLDLMPAGQIDRARVINELRWGNAYFLKMQEPDGFVMNYCGGDDGNNFTDNRIGTSDDRRIHVEPCELPAQFHFIAAQAAMMRHTRDDDAEYARKCEDAAKRCLNWCEKNRSPGAATSLSAGIIACVELHRATDDANAAALAAEYAKKLLSLQVRDDLKSGILGFFLTAPDHPEPLREIQHGNLPLIALCEIVKVFADHPDAPTWRKSLEVHCKYLFEMSNRSAFGTIPFGLYTGKDPGGNRRIGDLGYRWFMKPKGETAAADWWVGINAHLASNGVGLLKASRLLNEPKLAALAQRQLDWIVGANPFDASTVTDAGHNQPPLYRPGAFKPPTPLIPGGVMNGIGGSDNDEPILFPGSYHTCEYWTPMVAYTMWLLAESGRA